MKFPKITKKRILFSGLFAVIVASVIGTVLYQKVKEAPDYMKHCHSAKRLYQHFVDFNEDYLSMPGPEAAEMDAEIEGFDYSSSNGYLGQLLVAMNANSEENFFLEGSSVCSGEKPDNIVAPNQEALKAGENGWAYFTGRDLETDGKLPLLVPGWNPATKKWDDPLWDNGIPVLFVDGTVILYRAGSNGTDEGYETTTDPLPFDINDPNLLQPLAK